MHQRGISRSTTILVAIFIAAVVITFLAVQPITPKPDEGNRNFHPAGFSIIVPANWAVNRGYAIGKSNNYLQSAPAKAEGITGEFTVEELNDAPTEEILRNAHFSEATFDGKPAWITRAERTKARQHTVVYVFQRGGRWFQAKISRPMSEPIEGPPWDDYVKSIHVEKPAAVSTTQTAAE